MRQVLAERLAAEDLPDLEVIRSGVQFSVSPVVTVAGRELMLEPEDLPRTPGASIRLLDRAAARAEAHASNHDVTPLPV